MKNYISKKIVAVFTALFVISILVMPPLSADAVRNNKVDVLIGFNNTPGNAEHALVKSFGGTIKHSYLIVPAVSATIPEAALKGLSNHPLVTVVEMDGEVKAISFEAELDNTWGVKRIGSGQVHIDGNLGVGVKVAVIDSGIDCNHPDLIGRCASGYNFVSGNSNFNDDNGHGTHVSGTVAALRDGAGVVGVSPSVDLYGLKVLDAGGSGAWSNVIAALDWASTNGIQVTNNSYGSGSNPGTVVQAAFDNTYNNGMLHIAAAGNSGNCGGRGNSVGYPARYASVVAVAATNQNDTRPCFSSTGPDVEISAPGVFINSTIPGGGYASWSGTSMASPHVAGVAALVMSAGQINNTVVRDILNSTADPLGNSNHYGSGLVNAVSSVSSIVGDEPPADEEPPPEEEEPPVEEDPPVDDPEDPVDGTATVNSITYSTSGGKNNDRHLSVAVSVEDNNGNSVGGAVVSITLSNDSGSSWNGSTTTSSSGTVTFNLNNAPSGCYTTTVTNVSYDGLTWDGDTPDNDYCK